MKITLEHYIETITVEVPEEATATDFANLMYRLSLMVGYNEKNAADAFAELGETYYTHNEPVTDKERLVRLYAVKLTTGEYGYMTGEFDRCHPPSLYTNRLENAMLFGDKQSAISFIENFEYKEGDYQVECYELHLVPNGNWDL